MDAVQKHINLNLPAIKLTSATYKRVLDYLRQNDKSGLRLSVKKTGCSGLSYEITYINEKHIDDIVVPLEDKYFISIDKKSYPYLKGVTMDYLKQGVNYKFIFNNPNQTGQCGCGESFTVG